MTLQGLLGPEIFTFDRRDFANWLKAGIPVYSGLKRPMRDQRIPDAFPYARGFIGRNEAGLPDDLKNVYDQLPSPNQVAMERGISLLWADTEFRNDAEIVIAETLLTLACRLPVKALVDVLPDALAKIAIAYEATHEDLVKRRLLQVRRLAFQAAVELASASGTSISCLEKFMEDDSFREPLLVKGQALKTLRYLGSKHPLRFVYWAGIFGQAAVSDYKRDRGSARELRTALEKEYGKETIEKAVVSVRKTAIGRLQTEDGALSLRSTQGLLDLVAILFAGRENTSDGDATLVIYPWTTDDESQPSTAQILDFPTRNEISGR